ncbi:MAG: STAS domain-containing protein [Oscillospiraceae bacterium]|nr:STAS domain-containing protein [Oscillospiraceae bacterium]
MNIAKTTNGTELTIALEGRLDTVTAPELETELRSCLDGVTALTLDMNGLDYISSAGLRVLLSAQKVMNRQGSMKLVRVGRPVMDVLEVTGFTDILTIE